MSETTHEKIAAIGRRLRDPRPPGRPSTPIGLGTRATPMPPAVEAISLADLSALENLDREEMVCTALAGTPVDDVARAALEVGLVLCPLFPIGTGGTLGGLYASGAASPCAPVEGHLRDAVLGIEGWTGGGAPLASGGRVVKNVTGYDLTRFLCGSRGSLGIVTRLHWRLRLAPHDSVEVLIETAPSSLENRIKTLRSLPDPTAVRIDLTAGRLRIRALVEGGRASGIADAESLAIGLGASAEIVPVPDDQLAAWLRTPNPPCERATVREWIERLRRLARSSDGSATVFPFIGVGSTHSGESATHPEGEFTRRIREAWDPRGNLWNPFALDRSPPERSPEPPPAMRGTR